jgi:chemotaxis protein histidine kinase CheA
MSSLFESMWPAFHAEVSEQLDELEIQLAAADADAIDVSHCFRLFHTIKSSAAMMAFTHMELLAHVCEDILDLVRTGNATLDDDMVDVLSAGAAQLKTQLAEADASHEPPGQDAQLLARAREFLTRLGGTPVMPADANPEQPAEAGVDADEERAVADAFDNFAAILEKELPALGKWLGGQGKRPPARLRTIASACEEMGFPALASIAGDMAATDPGERLSAASAFLLRLTPLVQRAQTDLGSAALSDALRPGLVANIHEGAARCLDVAEAGITHLGGDEAAVLASATHQLGERCRLCGFPALALLLRFIEQILREVTRGNLLVPDDLGELMMSGWSLCLELEADHGEDPAFAEICGRVLTTLQDMSRTADTQGDALDARELLQSEFDIPWSLTASLHDACLPDLLASCRNGTVVLDIEVDMDGPDAERDSFIGVINQHARIISNRTVFASERPGDLQAETTRLSIIAACEQNPGALIKTLAGFHSEHFHLAVQPVAYRGAPEIDTDDSPSPGTGTPGDPPVGAAPDAPAPEKVAPEPASTSNDTLRIASDRLDQFVTRVGELVLLRNQIDHHLHGETTSELLTQLQAFSQQLGSRQQLGAEQQVQLAQCLDALVAQMDRLGQTDSQLKQSLGMLQTDALDLRVVPVDIIFRRVPVLVRRLARQLGKQVRLDVQGSDTRIDKSMVDVLAEPLIHLVRNALDHGIETPDARRRAGKSEDAHITLRAHHQGGSLVIELEDDGLGLDSDAIRERAVSNGLLSRNQADLLPEEQVHALIFEPGFSTAAAVTETSGRGVGMDVVRTRVEQLGGEISLHSTPGHGTRVQLHLPTSAAIQGIVLFQAGADTYGLAERSVTEAIDIEKSQLQSLQGQMVVMHRERALPVYTLDHLFQQDGGGLPDDAVLQVLVLSDGRRHVGLVVNQILARQEIFVRECHPDIAALPGVAGASILGNGEPVLLLEASGLIELAAAGAQDLARLLEAS